jgi:hypothetical protein
MKDMKGFPFSLGCQVARSVMWGKSPMIEICTVTRIQNDKIYLNESKQAIRFPDRLLIVEQEPLYRMIKKFEMGKENDVQ